MGRFRPIAALLLSLLATMPVAAQGVAGHPAVARCGVLLGSLVLQPEGGPPRIEAEGEDGCRTGPLRFPFGNLAGYEVASLLIRSSPQDGGAGVLPASLRVEARGVAFSLRSGNAGLDWVTRQQQWPFDLVLDLGQDMATRRIVLRELSMRGEMVGEVVLSATVEGVAPLRADALPAITGAGLRSLRLSLDSRTFLTAFVLNAFVSWLPPDNPGAAVDAAREAATRWVRDLVPQAGLAPAAAEAIAGLVRDFPRPRHPFLISIEATRPIASADLEGATTPEGLAALFALLRVEARYEGTPR